ncbi:MAG: preprotein translocase subunit SecY [Sphingobium sp.]|nr:preprotein translocase subunit SecY [Sphingobium sp.]
MASSADRMAANISLAKFSQATDLKKRLWFTLGVLIVFRFLSFVPVPGVDPTALAAWSGRSSGGILDIFNTFSGGAMSRASLLTLGIMPYITASIVVQLAASLSPQLEALKKEGESGRKKLNQYTRYGTVGLAAVQGYFAALNWQVQNVAVQPGTLFIVSAVISLIGGTLFLMWLGEQITSRGIGNGASLIIMAGIVAQGPVTLSNLLESGRTGSISGLLILGTIILAVALVAFICFMERAQRRVLIQYPKRQTRQGIMQADRSHLPLKVNTAGVIPPIFASSLLLLPLTITQFAGKGVNGDSWWGDAIISINQFLAHGSPTYMTLYGLGIIVFCMWYTAIIFNPEETAENLKRNGGFIPGIRPGKNTELYLDYVLTRLTVVGAAYLTVICLIPEFLIAKAGIPFRLGGTSLLIVVNVTVDTVTQIQSHLIAHQYGDLIKKARLKGKLR